MTIRTGSANVGTAVAVADNANGIVWGNMFAWAVPTPGALSLLAIALAAPSRRRR